MKNRAEVPLALFITAAALYIVSATVALCAEDADILLDKIIVTNRRVCVGSGRAAENVSVLSAEEMKHLPANDLGEVLGYVSGVDIEPRQGFGRGTSVGIQGSDSRQVRVMIDGIPLNNQASGQMDPSRFPLENIARIEVIKGPSSSMWGSALGGVINIITKDTGTTATPQGSFATSLAEFRTRRHSGDLAGRWKDLGYYISSSYMESGGQGPRDDVLQKNAFGKLSYEFDDTNKLLASFGYNDADVNSGRFPDDTWIAQPYLARYGKISWQKEGPDWQAIVDLKHAFQDITTDFFLSPADDEPFFVVRTKDQLSQLSLNAASHPRQEDLFVLGADLEWRRLKTDYLMKSKALTLAAPYLNYTLALDPWDLNSGLRFDYNSAFGKEFAPSVGAVYHFKDIPETSLRLRVSRAFNAPPLLWKHYELILSGLANNPDIRAERAWVYEAGLESRPWPRLWLKLSLYRADVSDALALSRNEDGDYFMKNFARFRRQGAEFQSGLKLTKDLGFSCAAAFNDVVDRATGEIVRGAGKPRQSIKLGIDYKDKGGFSFSILGYYNRWNEPADAQPNDRKMLVDVSISQQRKNITLFLNIRNVANSKYWADYFFPTPPRYFEGGVTFNW